MCESLCSTSPLPYLEQKKTNSNIPMSLNSYITHSTREGSGGPLHHTHSLWGLAKIPPESYTAFGNTACHSLLSKIRNGYCDYLTTTFTTTKKAIIILQIGFYSLSPLPLPSTLFGHLLPPFFLLPPHLLLFLLLLTRNTQRNM